MSYECVVNLVISRKMIVNLLFGFGKIKLLDNILRNNFNNKIKCNEWLQII